MSYVDCAGCPMGLQCVRCSRIRKLRDDNCLLAARILLGEQLDFPVFFPGGIVPTCCLSEKEIQTILRGDEND